MVDADFDIDLFGDPVEPAREGRGRPPFEWTLERSNRVLLAFARNLSVAQAADLIDCDSKTLRKHFSRECKMRTTAQLRMEQRQLERLNAEAEKGNVAAEKALAERMEKLRMRDRAQQAQAPRPSKPKKLGKKEAAQEAAARQSGIFTPPPAPGSLN